ncbi:MAG TPA: prolyl oligopeptidase family serine peptidase, partial [Burkholderiaceae bacterium]|nr:prolyl oligopeptidase family serine peptidase [Burkholderiaceae bacterium]
DPARPAPSDWATVLPERPEVLQHVTSAGGRLFANYLKDVRSQIQVFGLDGTPQRSVELPGPGTADGFAGERGDTEVFYTFDSMQQPPTIFRYDLASGRSSVFRAPEIAGYDASRYESRQVFFASRDGTRVPMFLVFRKGLKLDGRNPTILYGYGGFNVTMTPYFSAPRIAWLEQGGVFAMANLRGGGEYGEAWHEAGMRLSKQNVFDDCIAAAEFLIREGYTSPQRLALQGGSNGGLLVGAVVNQRPDLFRVALPEVGVMDMLRFQKFSVGAAWTADYGSSDDPAQFANLLRYSPLHNIREGSPYPATLVTTADHDDRVVPAHSFKYIATLQAKAGAGAPKLIRIETNSGHGSSNLSKRLDLAADLYAFSWSQMNVVPSFPPP